MMISEKKEKQILIISFAAGVIFAFIEFLFAIYSRSQSSLTDAVYDASELVFIALLLFLTPLFHKPISEKRPYGYFQLESIFVIVKSVMMLSVTLGISAQVIQSFLSGGNQVDNAQIAFFQLILGIASIIIYIWMKYLNYNSSSPTVIAELLGWKLDIIYSLGMSFAFFISLFLKKTSFYPLAPYFDQIIAICIMFLILPESIKVLFGAVKDLFLFSPSEELSNTVRESWNEILMKYQFHAVFFDITKTGRHIWIAVYFTIETDYLAVEQLKQATTEFSEKMNHQLSACTCELILVPKESEK